MAQIRRSGRTAAASAVGLAGAGAAGLTAFAVAGSDVLSHPSANAAARGVAVALFVAVGAYTWWRRPASRLGLLIAGIGLSFSLTSLMAFGEALPFTLGRIALAVFVTFTVSVFTCFPRDRLRAGLERTLVRGLVASSVGLWALVLALSDQLPVGGPVAQCVRSCPPNALQLVATPASISHALAIAVSALTAISLAGVTAVLFRSSRSARRLRRRAVEPLLWTMAATILSYAVYIGMRQAGVGGQQLPGTIAVAAFLSLPVGILAGQIRGRMFAVSELARLVAATSEAAVTPQMLEPLIADALGDPTSKLILWSTESQGYVDVHGAPVDATLAAVDRGDPLAMAVINDPGLGHEPEIIEAMTAAATLLLENARLSEALRASRTRVAHATQLERLRLERDLHDGAQQRLTAMQIKLSLVRELKDEHERGVALDELADDAATAIEELRSLARGIYPTLLRDRGLGDALRGVAATVPGSVPVRVSGTARYPTATEEAIYFSALEAVQNAMKHARPGGHLELALECTEAWVSFAVTDDGDGFDVELEPAGLGLESMRERMAAVGGSLNVDSAPGRGTTVAGRAPARYDPASEAG